MTRRELKRALGVILIDYIFVPLGIGLAVIAGLGDWWVRGWILLRILGVV
jgi:hypothetical protein